MQIQLLLLDSNVDVFFEKEKEMMKWNRLRCVVPCVKWVCISIHFIVDDFALNSVVLITSMSMTLLRKKLAKNITIPQILSIWNLSCFVLNYTFQMYFFFFFIRSICFSNKYQVDSGTKKRKREMERCDYSQERNHRLLLIIISFIRRNNNNCT